MKKQRKKLPCKWNNNAMYSMNDDGTVTVSCYYGGSMFQSFRKMISGICLDDFYDPENNLAFRSYCDDFVSDDNGSIGCQMAFGTVDGKMKVALHRKSLGDLFDVLYCIRLGGVAGKTPFDNEDGGPFGSLLSLYGRLLTKEATKKKLEKLKVESERFSDFCKNAESAQEVIDYITKKLCMRKKS